MKGIILAGGSGTRLYPLTQVITKQLIPIYDKPMIYYPLSILMLANIKDIMIITTENDNLRFKNLLGDGSHLGINIEYCIQRNPNGLPEAFILAEDFIGDDNVCLILGDNIFYGDNFINKHILPHIKNNENTVFAYYVNDPHRYGVVEFNKNQEVLSIEEKPENPKSNFALTGLYMFDSGVVDIAKNIKPSKRGETEIVDVINAYVQRGDLVVEKLGRGISWLDTGTHESLLQASNFVEVIEQRQGLRIACIEEIAYTKNYISKEQLLELAEPLKKNSYGQYLIKIANEY